MMISVPLSLARQVVQTPWYIHGLGHSLTGQDQDRVQMSGSYNCVKNPGIRKSNGISY